MDLLRHIRSSLFLLLLAVPMVYAQGNKTIHIIVPWPPGGAADAIARTLVPKLEQGMGQPVVVENKAGAGGQLGTKLVKAARPDGLTVMFTSDPPVVTAPVLYDNVGYDPMMDFTALGQVARFKLGLSTATKDVSSLRELMELMRAHPGRANYGTPAVGGLPSMIAMALKKQSGVAMTEVAYKGSPPLLTDLIGGQIVSGITGLTEAIPMVQAGRIRMVAITGTKRSSALPDVPTFEELGVPGLSYDLWFAFFGPRGLPTDFATRFNRALNEALMDPNVKQKLAEFSVELAPTSLKEADDELKKSAQYWNRASKQPGFVRP